MSVGFDDTELEQPTLGKNAKIIWNGVGKWTPTIVSEENEDTISIEDYKKPDPLPSEDKLYKWGSYTEVGYHSMWSIETCNKDVRETEKHPNFYKGHNYTEEEIKCIWESEKLRYKTVNKETEKKFLEEGKLPPEPDMEKCLEIMDKVIYPKDPVYKEEPQVKSILIFYVDVGQLPPDKADAFLSKMQEQHRGIILRLKKQGVETMWIRRGGPTQIELIKF